MPSQYSKISKFPIILCESNFGSNILSPANIVTSMPNILEKEIKNFSNSSTPRAIRKFCSNKDDKPDNFKTIFSLSDDSCKL